MAEYCYSPVPGVYVQYVDWRHLRDVSLRSMVANDYSLSSYIYVETLFGIPFDVEVYFPLLGALLIAARENGELRITDTDTLSTRDLVHPYAIPIELSSSHHPYDYLTYNAQHSIEELFFNEHGDFSLMHAVAILLEDLISWRTGDLVAWEYTMENMSPTEPLLLNEHDEYDEGMVMRTRGGAGTGQLYKMKQNPPFNYDYPQEFRDIDKYVDEAGNILNAPTYEETKKASLNVASTAAPQRLILRDLPIMNEARWEEL